MTHDEDVRLNPMSDKYDWLRCLTIGKPTDYCAIPKGALRDYVTLHDALMEEHDGVSLALLAHQAYREGYIDIDEMDLYEDDWRAAYDKVEGMLDRT